MSKEEVDLRAVKNVLDGKPSRRSFLKATGAIGAAALSGCVFSSDPGPGSRPSETTPTETDTPTETATRTQTPTPQIPDSGTLNIILEDEPWPEDYFNGDVDLELRNVDENGEEGDLLTSQQLREQQHYQQIYEIVDEFENKPGGGMENYNILRQFPKNLANKKWIKEEIIDPLAEEKNQDSIPVSRIFQPEKYTAEGNLNQRLENSGYDSLWRLVAMKALDGVSSANDSIKTAALTAAEYETAGKDTVTFNMKTNNEVHGLGFGLTGLTYNEDQLEQQETWGIETDPGEKEFIWDLDETETYVNRGTNIFLDTEKPDSWWGWKRIGTLTNEIENLEINIHGRKEWENFLRNPDKQKGMKYLDSSCITGYINRHATQNGPLDQLHNATLEVYPDKIEYRL